MELNMEPNVEPVMEPVSAGATISGEDVITDLCACIAERLSRDCNLRASDCYTSYAAQVSIDLQLVDIDRVEVKDDIVIGTLDPEKPSQHIKVAVPDKRVYVSRIRGVK